MEPLLPVVRTVCLLESRSEQYGDYLARVLGPAPWIDAWAAEEATHGARLRDWLTDRDPGFDFEDAFTALSTLPYHPNVASDRTPAEELLARCVVEALAAGFYRAMRDAAATPSLRALCAELMRDEVRHYKGFLRRLRAEHPLSTAAKLRVMAQRVRELDDDQIAFAAHSAYGHGPYRHRAARRDYLGRVYPLYQREHLSFMQAMLFTALGGRPPRRLRTVVSAMLHGALGVRRAGLALGVG